MYVLHHREQTALAPPARDRQHLLQIPPAILAGNAQDLPDDDLLPPPTGPGVRRRRTETRGGARLQLRHRHGLHRRLHVRPAERDQLHARRPRPTAVPHQLPSPAPLPFLVQRAPQPRSLPGQVRPHHRAQIRARSHQRPRKLDPRPHQSRGEEQHGPNLRRGEEHANHDPNGVQPGAPIHPQEPLPLPARPTDRHRAPRPLGRRARNERDNAVLPLPRALAAPGPPAAAPTGTPPPLPAAALPSPDPNLEPRPAPAPKPGRPAPPARLPHGNPARARRDPGAGTARHAREAHLPRRLPAFTRRRARERAALHAAPPRGRVPGSRGVEAGALARGGRGAEGGDGALVLGVWERGQDVHREQFRHAGYVIFPSERVQRECRKWVLALTMRSSRDEIDNGCDLYELQDAYRRR